MKTDPFTPFGFGKNNHLAFLIRKFAHRDGSGVPLSSIKYYAEEKPRAACVAIIYDLADVL